MLADRRQSGFVYALRVHKSLTAEVEKRVLVWMAERTPKAISSDHLTALGFVAQLLAGAAYALAAWDPRALWLVNFFLVLNWLGDSLDGTLARVRNQQRPRYGFYVDHMADTFGALALMAGLACSGYVHWQVAAGMLVCFYVLSIESYLATYTMGHFHLSHGIFGPDRNSHPAGGGKRCAPRASLCGHRRPALSAVRRWRRCGHCRNGIHGHSGRNSAHRRAVPGRRAAMTSAGRLLARRNRYRDFDWGGLFSCSDHEELRLLRMAR